MVRPEFLRHQTAHRILQNQLNSGRLSHAYLFAGPARVGKLAAARAFAAAVNCPKRRLACACAECTVNPETLHPDLHLLQPDGNSIKLQQVRSLLSQVGLTPNQGARRIFIIESADCLTREAANALLLTLEEPSASALFILTADSPILPTISSRCQVIQFHRGGQAEPDESTAETEALALLEQIMRSAIMDRSRFAEEIVSSAEQTDIFLATILDVLRALFVRAGGGNPGSRRDRSAIERFGQLFPSGATDLADRCQAIIDAGRMLMANVNRRLVIEQLLFSL